MIHNKRRITSILTFFLMSLLIFDTKTAISSTEAGILLCIHSVIPSLYPFIFLSGFVTSCFSGCSLPILKPLCNRLGIPNGTESLYFIGLLGGYPTGAKVIYQAYSENRISKHTALRLLGFFSNAGPAFIFGVISKLFSRLSITWALWTIHILSSLVTAAVLPGKLAENYRNTDTTTLSIPQAISNSIQTMSVICGWVIVFRIFNAYLQKHLLRFLPSTIAAITYGILELVNGCNAISDIGNEGTRFIIISGTLAFGGICVWLQTISVTKDLGTGMYLRGKLLQSVTSVILATLYVMLDFSFMYIVIISASFMMIVFFPRSVPMNIKKTVAKY